MYNILLGIWPTRQHLFTFQPSFSHMTAKGLPVTSENTHTLIDGLKDVSERCAPQTTHASVDISPFRLHLHMSCTCTLHCTVTDHSCRKTPDMHQYGSAGSSWLISAAVCTVEPNTHLYQVPCLKRTEPTQSWINNITTLRYDTVSMDQARTWAPPQTL